MNSKFLTFAMFVFGAAIGSAITWQYAKKKYEQIAHDEIDSVKAVFSKKAEHTGSSEKHDEIAKAVAAKTKPNITEYASRISEYGYTNYQKAEVPEHSDITEEKESNSMLADGPYVISPDAFSEFDDYKKISLTYYSDEILADDDYEVIEDIDEVVGFDSLTGFGEYEDDSVFVRNDNLKCDYEILLDYRKYSDVVKGKPHEVDD